LLLLDCGIARGPKPEVDSESHFLGCTSETDCGGIAGATCAGGWCVDVETGERIGLNALGNEQWDTIAPDDPAANFPADGEWQTGVPLDPAAPQGSVAESTEFQRCWSSSAEPIKDQGALERLAGCETVYGDLQINFDADLQVLSSLRDVEGNFHIQPEPSHQLSSLAGLENLERVSGDLLLQYLHAPSLASLANLQSVQRLILTDSRGPRDLSGLAQLTGLQNLWIAGSFDLTSLDGLTLPSRMDTVDLSDLPALTSLPPFSASHLNLTNTGLTDLSVVTRPVDELAVRRNSLLVDATVSGVDRLIVENNRALVSLSLPAQSRPPTSLEVSENSALESIEAPENVISLSSLSVHDNPVLHTIRMPGLQELDTFLVSRNPSLSAIEFPLLIQQVQDLTVVSNPNLSMPSIFSITGRARKSKLAGNQGDPLFLDPCPYIRDTYCDELDSICAPGTDRYDCGETL
jgi:hypothetical protein